MFVLIKDLQVSVGQINTSGSKKYYVDVTSPNTVTYDTYTATDTYYYFENNVIPE